LALHSPSELQGRQALVLASQTSPPAQSLVEVHPTQVPRPPAGGSLQIGVEPPQSAFEPHEPLLLNTQVFCGEQVNPAGQSLASRHPTQLPLDVSQTGVGLAQSWALSWQMTGATQWLPEQMGLAGSAQSPPSTHSTQECCDTRQTGSLLSVQSWFVEQPGCATQAPCWQSLPWPQSRAVRQPTQVAWAASQSGVEGFEAQS
jgi:hypothetical protein